MTTMPRFGLIMHVGREGKQSKSEEIHIPSKVTDKPIAKGTIVIMNNNTHLHFTDKIKYTGSSITTNPRYEINVATRIAIAHSQRNRNERIFQLLRCIGSEERNDVPSDPTQHGTMGM
jgi:hypothetical protein